MEKVKLSLCSLASMQHAPANHDASRVMSPPSPTAEVVRPASNSYVGNPSRMLTRSQARRERERRAAGALGVLLNSAQPSPGTSPSSPNPLPPPPPATQQQQQQLPSSSRIRKSRAAKKVTGPVAVSQKSKDSTANKNKNPIAPIQKVKKITRAKSQVGRIAHAPVPPTPVPAAPNTVVPSPTSSSSRVNDLILRSRAIIRASVEARNARKAKRSGALKLDDEKVCATSNKRKNADTDSATNQKASVTNVPQPQELQSQPRPKSVAARKTKKTVIVQESDIIMDDDGLEVESRRHEVDQETIDAVAPSAKRTRSNEIRLSPDPMSVILPDGDEEMEIEMALQAPLLEQAGEPAPIAKTVTFHRNVSTRWTSRIMGQNGPHPYYMTAEPQFDSIQRLKRPRKQVHPRRITTDEMIAIGDDTNFDDMPNMENPKQRRGCSNTCSVKGCAPNCSCKIENLECSSRYDCPCLPDCCDRWDSELAKVQRAEARKEETAAANEKTAGWPANDQSTLSSVGSFDYDKVVLRDISTGSDSLDLSDESEGIEISMECEEVMVRASEESEPSESTFVRGNPEAVIVAVETDAGEEVEDDRMDVNEDEEKEVDQEVGNSSSSSTSSSSSSSSPSSSSSSSSSSSEDDDDIQDYIGRLPIDLTPGEFPQQMLDMLIQMVGRDEEATCMPQAFLGADAVFVGLLKIATLHNRNSHIHGRHAAVLHPQVFFEALRVAKEEAAELERKKLARVRGPIPLPELDANVIAQLAVYGSGWTEMFVPINVNNNHWVLAVIQRATVDVVVYDSRVYDFTAKCSREVLVKAEEKRKHEEMLKLRKAALRQILAAIQKLNPGVDKTTARFKIRFARALYCNLQTDGTSCGLFTMLHARRSLMCQNSNLKLKRGEAAMNILEERQILQRDIVRIREALERMSSNNVRLMHGNDGMKKCVPGPALIKLRWSGKH